MEKFLTEPMFLLGAFLILATIIIGILAVVKFVKDTKKAINTPVEEKFPALKNFKDAGYNVTRFDRNILIDEQNQKWACVDNANVPIMDFSDIVDVELVENGIKYKSENGVLRAAAGGALFGAAGAIVGASTANRTQKASQIYVVVYTKNLSFPTIRFDVTRRTEAEKLVGVVNAMGSISAGSQSDSKPVASAADEIAKYKSLLDSGAITQEEYDKKKSELLNL